MPGPLADDRDLLLAIIDEIIYEFDMGSPTPRDPSLPGTESGALSDKWINTFYGDDFIGLHDRDQWRDHDM